MIEIKPLPRGSGFKFTDTITGGVVPKQYIQSVETGVRDFLKSGPLGFPGRRPRRQPLRRLLPFGRFLRHGLPDGRKDRHEGRHGAVLAGAARADHEGRDLHAVGGDTAKITGLVPQRRGQILGYDARPGWPGWDVVEATMPQSEIGDLIIELRSATAGVASYRASFDHMAELTGRLADEVMNASGKAA